jgi:hypothetical protein
MGLNFEIAKPPKGNIFIQLLLRRWNRRVPLARGDNLRRDTPECNSINRRVIEVPVVNETT